MRAVAASLRSVSTPLHASVLLVALALLSPDATLMATPSGAYCGDDDGQLGMGSSIPSTPMGSSAEIQPLDAWYAAGEVGVLAAGCHPSGEQETQQEHEREGGAGGSYARLWPRP